MDIFLQELYHRERTRIAGMAGGGFDGQFDSPVFGEGALSPRLMLIGEAPGAEEARLGRPFVGKAGRQLDTLLEASRIGRSEVYITNAVKYRPITFTKRGMKNRTPSKKEISLGLELLKQEILHKRPLFVATLGNTPMVAVHALSGLKNPVIGEAHGRMHRMELSGFSYTLFPLYHPASVIYNRTLLPICEQDLIGLGKLVNNR